MNTCNGWYFLKFTFLATAALEIKEEVDLFTEYKRFEERFFTEQHTSFSWEALGAPRQLGWLHQIHSSGLSV